MGYDDINTGRKIQITCKLMYPATSGCRLALHPFHVIIYIILSINMPTQKYNDQPTLENILTSSTPYVKSNAVKIGREKFIKGPIPLKWLTTAASLSPTAVKLGLVIWFLSGLTKQKTVKLTNRYLNEFAIHRTSKYKNLKRMEKAGLIRISQRKGESPMVTIVV